VAQGDEGDGHRDALDRLTPVVYRELHCVANRYLRREQPGLTLQATELINEVYLRLMEVKQGDWESRAQFFGFCAQLMRRILTDRARKQRNQRHGGNRRRVSFDEGLIVPARPDTDLEALDDALNGLEAVDPRKSRVVELRFYGGLTVEETAAILKVSVETVARDWRLAKLWLLREMNGGREVEA